MPEQAEEPVGSGPSNPSPRRLALGICAGYAVLGGGYIVASDLGLFGGLGSLLPGSLPGDVMPLSIAKGLAFIVVTASLLYLVMLRAFRRLERESERTAEVERAREQLADALPDIYFEIDTAARISAANRRATEVMGMPRHELLGRPAISFIDEADRPSVDGALVRLIENGEPQVMEAHLVTADGVRSYLWNTAPRYNAAGTIVGAIGIGVSIANLRTTDANFRYLFARNPVAMFVYHAKTFRLIEANDAALQLYGYERAAVASLTVLDLLDADEWRSLRSQLGSLAPGDVGRIERMHRTKSRAALDVVVSHAHIEFDGEDAILAVVLDRTEERRLARRLDEAIDAMTDAFIMFDTDHRLVRCNRRWREMFAAVADIAVPGVHRADIIRASLERGLVDTDNRDNFIARRLRQRTTPETVEGRYGDRWFRYSDWSMPDGGTVGIRADVTELKRTQAELARAQRMDAIGQLTGGIAHDFNNLLLIVLGNLEMLHDRISAGDTKSIELVDIARQAADRGADLTRRLLAYSRRQSLSPSTCIVGDVLAESILPLLEHSLPASIEVDMQSVGAAQAIRVDARELETAILNLALNARDAMPQGGRIDIRVATQRLDAEFVTRHGGSAAQAGDFVCLTFADTGSGIPRDIVERVFEPFFTTKDVGQGTGLGLSMVYGFVTRSGGFVDLYSEPGNGTVFRLYFPVADGATDDRAAPLTAHARRNGGGRRILVVDDEEGVRRLLVAFLTDAGYAVEAAVHAFAARDLLDSGAAFDLLITDLVLPKGMNGFELAAIARERLPGIEVVFMSGYPRLPDGRLADGSGVTLLEKPFTRERLLVVVDDFLERPAAGPVAP